MKKNLILLVLVFISSMLHAQYEWDNQKLPELPSDKEWELIPENSDEFKYNNKNDAFFDKWFDNNGPSNQGGAGGNWSGPGETLFLKENSSIEDSKLVIKATRIDQGGKKIGTSYCAMKQRIEYPIYFEAKMKCNGLTLASNFWTKLGDIDNKTEIDVTESYAWGKHNTGSHKAMNTNWHNFRGGNDSKQKNISTDVLPASDPLKGKLLREHYFTFGCYWKGPKEIEWYMNGVKVRSTADGNEKAMSTNFDEGLRIIFDVESHEWLSKRGITPTTEELEDDSRNRMYVEWIRSYKPVESDGNTIKDKVSLKDPEMIISSQKSYAFEVNYETIEEREVLVSFWKGDQWLGEGTADVDAGTGIQTVIVNLDKAPELGNDYGYKYHIRPRGTSVTEATAFGQVTNVIVNRTLGILNTHSKRFAIFPNPTSGMVELQKVPLNGVISIYDIMGRILLEKKIKRSTTQLDLDFLNSGSYIIRVDGYRSQYLVKL